MQNLVPIEKIVSGGQTGVDRAALDAALELGIPCGGWCPKNRCAEDGQISRKYPLRETPTETYAQRTEWNALTSDGTLILTRGSLTGGTAYTVEIAQLAEKPLLLLQLSPDVEKTLFTEWIFKHDIKILNIAGARESQARGIYEAAKAYLLDLLKA